MAESVRVSVVVPVYNTKEEYLLKCIESLEKQTYKDVEILLVDDGSKQECADLCDMLAEQNANIKVFHQQNAGVCAARNFGTEQADGKYIMYVDSDDIMIRTAIEEGVTAMETSEAQFSFAAVKHIHDYEDFGQMENAEIKVEPVIFEHEGIDKVRIGFLTQREPSFNHIQGDGFVHRGPVSRMILKDVAEKVKFDPSLVLGEDVEWNMRVLNECTRICFIPHVWYGYLIYATSSLRKYYGNRVELYERYLNKLYDNNEQFCKRHYGSYASNMSVAFYSVVLYDFLPDECPLTSDEKRRKIRQVLRREPWKHLMELVNLKKIPKKFALFVLASKVGLGLFMLKLWEGKKKWRQQSA